MTEASLGAFEMPETSKKPLTNLRCARNHDLRSPTPQWAEDPFNTHYMCIAKQAIDHQHGIIYKLLQRHHAGGILRKRPARSTC